MFRVISQILKKVFQKKPPDQPHLTSSLHSSEQSSMMNGWGGWVCPTNSNFSYKVHYCYHSYTTVNLGFSQSSGNGGISGFYVWGFYRTAP